MILPPTFAWFLAVRYLATRWVNLIGMLGIALAVWAMIVVIAVFSGFIGEARNGIEAGSPNLLLTGLRQDADFAEFEPVLRQIDGVQSIAPRVHHYGLLIPHFGRKVAERTATIPTANSTANSRSVVLLGLDPELESATTGFRRWIDDAASDKVVLHPGQRRNDYIIESAERPFAVSPARIHAAQRLLTGFGSDLLGDQDGIVLGVPRLKYGDEIIPGQRVDIISARYEPNSKEFKKIRMITHLSGVFETRHRMLDLTVCMLDIDVLRDYLGEGDAELVTDIAIKVAPGHDTGQVATAVEAAIVELGGGQALDYEQQNATYLGAVDQERALMKIVLFAVMLVAGFLIFATLHMMVAQKVKDIGVLTAMGATPASSGAIFALGGVVVGFAGCILGAVIGCLSAFFLNDINDLVYEWTGNELFPRRVYSLDEVPIDLDPAWILQVVAGALILSLLVSWLPARRAARLDPIKALMHE